MSVSYHVATFGCAKNQVDSTPCAYVKVGEGSDQPCTFSEIPLITGRQRPRRPKWMEAEITAAFGADRERKKVAT